MIVIFLDIHTLLTHHQNVTLAPSVIMDNYSPEIKNKRGQKKLGKLPQATAQPFGEKISRSVPHQYPISIPYPI